MTMNRKKNLHVCNLGPLIPPFIDFIEKKFDDFTENHLFYITGNQGLYPYRKRSNIIQAKPGRINKLLHVLELAREIHKSDKVILHGLSDPYKNILLAFMPWVLEKCYWVIWGGDLYTYNLGQRTIKWYIHEVFRRWLIPKIGHFVTHIRGDYELAKEWYGARGIWHECFMYPSNLYHELPVQNSFHEGINILVGNSATPTNNHKEVLDRLRIYAQENITIYCPLSYGDSQYAEEIADYGKMIFAEKFIALKDFMPFDQYLRLLGKMDVAIFNHRRQQAMGNTITLLSIEKKVFMRSDVTQWSFLNSLGIKVFDVEKISWADLSSASVEGNKNRVKEYFSIENCRNQLKRVFG